MPNTFSEPCVELIEQTCNRSVRSLDTPIGVLAWGILHCLKSPPAQDRRLFQIDQLCADRYSHTTWLLEKLLL